MSIYDFFVHQLQNNQFASASLVAAPIAVLTYAVRRTPFALYRSLKKQIFLNTRINNDQEMYSESLKYLTDKVINLRWSKNFSLNSSSDFNVSEFSDGHQSIEKVISGQTINLGYGNHFGFYRGVFVIISRVPVESNAVREFKEYIDCSFLTQNRDIINQLKEDIQKYSELSKLENRDLSVKTNNGKTWKTIVKLKQRSSDSIFVKNNADKVALEHIEKFVARADWNRSRGLPNHTGILLSGPPGTCKTSLIHVIASQTKRDIHNFNLSSVSSEAEFSELLSYNKDWSKIILTIEDFDGTNADTGPREDDKSSNKEFTVSLSTLLNSLDGLMSPDGLVVIATTNHKEKIDPALLRKGRFDLQIEMPLCEKEEFIKMAQYFEYDPSEYTLDYFHPLSGADLRSLLLENGVGAVVNHQKILNSLR